MADAAAEQVSVRGSIDFRVRGFKGRSIRCINTLYNIIYNIIYN